MNNLKNLPFNIYRKISPNKVFAPFYHTVSDVALPHIKNLYPVLNVKSFINELEFLLNNFVPITPFDYLNHINDGKLLPSNAMLLSFDDGLKEIHDVVAPILIKKGVPAIFFINTDFIDNKNLFFRFKASLLVQCFIEGRAEDKINEIQNIFLPAKWNKIELKNKVLVIKYHQQELLETIAKIVNIDFKTYLKKHTPYLTSEQIINLITQGFYIGSHSIDHPEYQYLSYKEQINQTKNSTSFLNTKFKLKYNYFSFPFTDFGVTKQFFEESLYSQNKFLDLTFGCAGIKGDITNRHIQRFAMEADEHNIKQKVSDEYMKSILKYVVGKYYIKRK